MSKIIAKYRLIKDLPMLPAGVIFEHREYDPKHPDRGNIGMGVMILGWLNGNCQESWCGDTYIFPGQLAGDTEFFEKIVDDRDISSIKKSLLAEINKLKSKIESL